MGLISTGKPQAFAYRVEIDGRDMTDTWAKERRLLEITVVDDEGNSSDSVSFTFDDREPHIAWPPEGAVARVWLGNTEDELVDLGVFCLDAPTASSPPERLTVRGHAAQFVSTGPSMPMNTERFRVWTATTLGAMARTIASDHGLIARVQSELQGFALDSVEQLDETDLAFLKRIVAQTGGRVRIKGSSSGSGALEVVGAGSQLPQVVLSRKDIEQWSMPLGGRAKAGKAIAAWFNPKTGGSGIKEAGSGEPVVRLTEIFGTASEAASAAKSLVKDKDRESAQLSLTLTTLNTSIASGTEIAISGVRSEVDTTWNVVRVEHRANTQPRTSIVAEKST